MRSLLGKQGVAFFVLWLGVVGLAGAGEEGEAAPDFCLPSSEGKEVCLKDFRGKKNVVLLFYILDFTPG